MDVSDGLYGDLQKLSRGEWRGGRLRISSACVLDELARRLARADCERLALFGGDDYELLSLCPPDRAAIVEKELAAGRTRSPCIASA